MTASKVAPPAQPGVYRDYPDRDDATSTSSAVLLDNFDYPDEELPAYTDEPTPSESTVNHPHDTDRRTQYEPPIQPPFTTHDTNYSEYRTLFPKFSTDADALYQTIISQARYPPSYFVELHGNHEETRRNGNKETKEKILDFYIRINLTPLLYQASPEDKHILHLLPENKRGYRGGRIISLKPTISIPDPENSQSPASELRVWCERYVADKSGVKSFTLKREIINHDTKRLEQLLRSAIQETSYQGHLTIRFPTQHDSLVVYSPGLINSWRSTTWIRWVFYLSMLWIISWPILICMTARYEIVKAIHAYANKKPGDDFDRVFTVMSEVDWFHRWESAIRRAALARMDCKERCLEEDYRVQSLEADRRAQELARSQGLQGLPNTGIQFAGGALGFLGQGMRIADNYLNSRGWGGDC